MDASESVKTASTASNIGKELNVSEKEINGLAEAVGELYDKLSPISLRTDDKATGEGAQPDKARCEVDSAIHSINCRIGRQTERIRAMITDLQV